MASIANRLRKVSGPAIEALESRAYFSSGTPNLLVTVPGPISPTAISGQKFGDRIAVNVANDGTGAAKGKYTFTLFASTDAALGVDDSQIYQVSHSLNIGVQKNKTINLKVPTLPVNLNGAYFILAQVSGTQATAVGASTGTIAITPAHTDLTDSVTAVPTTGRIGHKVSITVVVANGGNTLAKGNLTIDFGLSANADGSSPAAIGSVSKHINVKQNTSKTLHLRVLVPLGSPSGNQYVVATVDAANAFDESDLMNNVSVSLAPISLQ